jgi:lipopolysaccharide export system protein LptC
MPKSIFVYLVALFFLIGSVLFLSSFFLNPSPSELIKQNDEIVFEAKNISINLGFKKSDFVLKVKSSMVNSLKEEKNLYVYQPKIDIFGKNTFLKIISNKGTIAYDKNLVLLENKTEISGKVNKKNILGKASKIDIDLNKKNLSSNEIILFIDKYEISVKEIILNDDEVVFKGSPIYLKDNEGLITETSVVKLKSNGELIFPSKLNIKNY